MKKTILAVSMTALTLGGCASGPDFKPVDTVVVVNSELTDQEAKALLPNNVILSIPHVNERFGFSENINGKKYSRMVTAEKSRNRSFKKGTGISYELERKHLFKYDVEYFYNSATRTVDREAVNTEKYKGYRDSNPYAFQRTLPKFDNIIGKKITENYQDYINDRSVLLSNPYKLSPQVKLLMSDSDMKKFNSLFTQDNVNEHFLDFYAYNFKGLSLVDEYVESQVKSLTANNFSGIDVSIDQNKQINFRSASLLAKPQGWSVENKYLKVTALNYKYEIENKTDKFITIDRAASFVNNRVNKNEVDLPLEIPPQSKVVVSHNGRSNHYRVTSYKPDESVKFGVSFEYAVEGNKHTLNGNTSFKPLLY
ncbi:hypothetical protein ACQKP8_06740 [Photobacterium alginatilyticum]|uniref:hypothetical protein n=1 Tax=Photobacterium alginatilyticum TaxID=1775171 RepID=UPI0040685114